MVNGIVPGEDDLRDGDEGIALLEQGPNDAGEGLRRVKGGVVAVTFPYRFQTYLD